MLTERQACVLRYIATYQQSNGGVSPSYDEIAAAVGFKSKGNLHATMTKLAARGFVRRLHNRSRAIEVLRLAPAEPLPVRYRVFRFDDRTKRLVEQI